ncbi:MAG: hypothetical protein SFT90_01530 [Rickettsiales bacterium]|nr:hypothetical protein [Rickettsiales bacterium]
MVARISHEYQNTEQAIVAGWISKENLELNSESLHKFLKFLAGHLRDTTWRDGKQANINHFIDHPSVKLGMKARARAGARFILDEGIKNIKDEIGGGGSALRPIGIYGENSFENLQEYAQILRKAVIDEIEVRGKGNLATGLKVILKDEEKNKNLEDLGINEDFFQENLKASKPNDFRKALEEKLDIGLWSVLHRGAPGYAYGVVHKDDQKQQILFMKKEGLAVNSTFNMNNYGEAFEVAPDIEVMITREERSNERFTNIEFNYSYNYYGEDTSEHRRAEIAAEEMISYIKLAVKKIGLETFSENKEKILLKIKDFSGIISENEANLIPEVFNRLFEEDLELKSMGVTKDLIHLHLHSQGRQNNEGYPAHLNFIFSCIEQGYSFSIDGAVGPLSDYFSHPNMIKLLKSASKRYFGVSPEKEDEFMRMFNDDNIVKIFNDYEHDARKACEYAMSKSSFTTEKMQALIDNPDLFGIAGGGKIDFIKTIKDECFERAIIDKIYEIQNYNNIIEKALKTAPEIDENGISIYKLAIDDVSYTITIDSDNKKRITKQKGEVSSSFEIGDKETAQFKMWKQLKGNNQITKTYNAKTGKYDYKYDSEKFDDFCKRLAFKINKPSHSIMGLYGLVTPGSFYHSQLVAKLSLKVFQDIDKFDEVLDVSDDKKREFTLKTIKMCNFTDFPVFSKNFAPKEDMNFVNIMTGGFGELPAIKHNLDSDAPISSQAFRVNKAIRYMLKEKVFGEETNRILSAFAKGVKGEPRDLDFNSFGSIFDALKDQTLKLEDVISLAKISGKDQVISEIKDIILGNKIPDVKSRIDIAKSEISKFIENGNLPKEAENDALIFQLALINNEPTSKFRFNLLIPTYGDSLEKMGDFHTSIMKKVIDELGEDKFNLLRSIIKNIHQKKDSLTKLDPDLNQVINILRPIDDNFIKKIYGSEGYSREFLQDAKQILKESLIRIACGYKQIDVRDKVVKMTSNSVGAGLAA